MPRGEPHPTHEGTALPAREPDREVHLEAGCGYAADDDRREAGRRAAREAVSTTGRFEPSAVLVFTSDVSDLRRMLAGVRSVTGEAPLVGCTTAGDICDGELRRGGVTVAVIASPWLRLAAGVGRDVSSDWRRALDAALEAPGVSGWFDPEDDSTRRRARREGSTAVGLMFAPGDTFSCVSSDDEVLTELRRRSSGILTFFGGSAADDWRMEESWVFSGPTAYPDGLVVGILETGLRVGTAMAHGLVPSSLSATVTSAGGYLLEELDGRPAAEVYAGLIGVDVDELSDRRTTHRTDLPLGLGEPGGDHAVCVASSVTRGGGLRMTRPVPEGAVVKVMIPEPDAMISAASRAARTALLRGGFERPAIGLVVDCTLRERFLADRYPAELAAVRGVCANAPLAGFLSYGEQGMDAAGGNISGNECINILAIGDELTPAARVWLENRRLLDGRSRATGALRNMLGRLQALMDGIEQGIVYEDGSRRVQMANERFCRMFDLPSVDVVIGSDGTDVDRSIAAVLDDGSDYSGVVRERLSERAPVASEELRTRDGRFLSRDYVPVTIDHTEAGSFWVYRDVTETRLAERRLRESEERFRTYVMELPVGAYRRDLEGSRILMANPEMAAMFGYDDPDAMIRCGYAGTYADDSQRLRLRRMLEERGHVEGLEVELVRRDGEHFAARVWAHVRSVGEEQVVDGVIVDITMQRELEERQRLLAAAIEQTSESIIITDLDDRILWVNPAFEESYGFTAGEVVGDRMELLRSGEKGDGPYAEISAALSRGETWTGRITDRRKDGSLYPQEATISPVRDRSGRVFRYVSAQRDISGQLEFERRLLYLHGMDTLLRDISDRMMSERGPLSVMDDVLESVGRFFDVSRTYLFRYEPGLERASNTFEWCAEGVEPFIDELQDIDMTGGLEWWAERLGSGEAVLVRDTSDAPGVPEAVLEVLREESVVSVIVLPVFVFGRLYGFVGLDETRRVREWLDEERTLLAGLAERLGRSLERAQRKRELEETLQLREQLAQSQKMEAIGQLAGGIAHDFNNLLQAMGGHVDLALASLPDDAPVRGNLDEVARAGERAARLVAQLLAFSRRQMMQPETLDLDDVIADLLIMLERVIGEHIRLRFEPGPGVKRVRADRSMMEQVLMNLCVNARDAMPEGGDLRIATEASRRSDAGCDPADLPSGDDLVVLTVTDTGEGMTRQVLERAFEPFFTTKPVGKGTGLGLATVYGIVRQHGGTVTAQSEPGSGSSFSVLFPRSSEPVGEGLDTGAEPPAGRGETLLLAEDERMVMELNAAMLRDAGYVIVRAADGQEAVEVFRRRGGEIDGLFMDVVMPRMGGIEALERIREESPDVPVLFTTGYSEEVLGSGMLSDERVRVLRKPCRRRELLTAIRRMLDSAPD